MHRRTFLSGATAAAGLAALGTALPSARPAAAATTADTVPRVLAERSSASGLIRPERRFDVVTVTGAPGDPHTAIRFETADGLGAWRPVHLHAEGRDDRDPVAAALVRAPEGATGYEVRSEGHTAAVNLADGDDLRLGGAERSALSAPDASASQGTVPFRTRAGWGADESWRFDDEGNDLWTPEFHPVQALTVHHTAMPTGDDHAADVRAVYYLHAVEQAWGDIGYHVLIDPEGTVYEGRHSGGDGVPVFSGPPLPGDAHAVTAGHAFGFNHGNVGVCLLGDFTDTLPTEAAQDALVGVLRVLCAVTGVDPSERIEYVNPGTGAVTPGDALSRHRDWLSTECPGNAFADVFDTAIRDRVVAGLA